jgi:hypothetical protein
MRRIAGQAVASGISTASTGIPEGRVAVARNAGGRDRNKNSPNVAGSTCITETLTVARSNSDQAATS